MEKDASESVFILIGDTLTIYVFLIHRTLLKCNLTANPLAPMSEQGRISPYNIDTILRRQVMRVKKNMNSGIIS